MARVKSIAVDPEADTAYVSLLGDPAVCAEELAHGIVVDYAADGRPVGVEILSVRERVGTGEPYSYLRGLVEGLLMPGREAAE